MGLAVVVLLAACGEEKSKKRHRSGNGSTDTTAPTVLSVTPADGATIGNGIGNDTIIIVFSESMDPDSHVIGGGLAASDDGGTWQTTTVTNDTLVLAPVGTTTAGQACDAFAPCWSSTGGTNSLIITAEDTAGNPSAELQVGYLLDNDNDGVQDTVDACPGDDLCQ